MYVKELRKARLSRELESWQGFILTVSKASVEHELAIMDVT